MDVKHYEAMVWELASLPEEEGDIWDSEYYEEMLSLHGQISPEESMEAITRMQLAEEGFSSFWEEAGEIPEDLAALLQKRDLDLHRLLQEKLNAYEQEEQQGLLVGMLEGSRQLSGHPMGEREIILLVRITTEELLQYLLEDVKHVSHQLFSEEPGLQEVFDSTAGKEAKSETAGAYHVAAAAAAAYICEPGLRDLPEILGVTSAAAATVAEGKDCADQAQFTRTAAYMLQMMSYRFVLEVLLLPLSGTARACASIARKAAVTFAGVAKSFLDCMGLLVAEVRAAAGGQGVRMVEDAVRSLKGWDELHHVQDGNPQGQIVIDIEAGEAYGTEEVREEEAADTGSRDAYKAGEAMEEELTEETEEAKAGSW